MALSDEDKFEALINEAMDRLRFKDKSFIYDNEFAYYREKYSFDYFLQEVKIKGAESDTLEFVDVLNVTFFGQDSAVAEVDVHFKGPTGNKTTFNDKGVVFYWHEGRWIKPTVSNPIAQKEYEDIRNKAKDAAKSESGGKGK
jgi:hypothetical protein